MFEELNRILRQKYGCNDANKSLFRVVFSDDQIEKRFGTYAEYYGKLFIREFTGVKDNPKYPWIKHRWVLERWAPPSMVYDPQIPDTLNGSYEPVQVFEHADGNPVPVTERICDEIIWNLFNVPLPGDSKSRHMGKEAEEFEKEVEINKLHLEEAGSPLIKDGESVI